MTVATNPPPLDYAAMRLANLVALVKRRGDGARKEIIYRRLVDLASEAMALAVSPETVLIAGMSILSKTGRRRLVRSINKTVKLLEGDLDVFNKENQPRTRPHGLQSQSHYDLPSGNT